MHFAAKLLFQFRVDRGRATRKRRLCEERIVLIEARSARDALTKAKQKGRRAETHYENASGYTVYFEFVGVLELLALGVECAPDEVWYELPERVAPMERRDEIIPVEHELNAICNEIRSVSPLGDGAGTATNRRAVNRQKTRACSRRSGRKS
jgi:hypothetical protein